METLIPASHIDAPDYESSELIEMLQRRLTPAIELVRRLGAGAMGTVFLGRDPALKRLVGIKVLVPSLARDPSARARFEREAEAVAAIAHPNVVAIYTVGELPNGVPYFVMQYVSGRSCAERLAADGTFDAATTKRILGEVASALAAAHRQHIVHRDIKPANILIDDATGRAVVSDFGIAAVRAQDDGADHDPRLTMTGTSVGTPAYMSPEQVLAEPVTAKTDIYSLGLLGYELLTGRSAYDVASPREIVAAHLRDAPIKLSTIIPDIDPEFESLLEACLEKSPEARPTAADVERRLAGGADVMLEWPPPGLDDLNGRLPSLLAVLGSGSVALGIPLFLLAAFDADSVWRSLLPPPVFLASIVAIGLLLLAWSGAALARLAVQAARAVRAGHGWFTVAETLVDGRHDTGALIAGAREFAALPPDERGRLRFRRLIQYGLMSIATILPVSGFFLVLPVAARSGRGGPAVLMVVDALALVLAALAIVLAWDEGRRLRTPRRRLRSGRSTPELLTRLVAAWREAFDQVRRGQLLGSGRSGRHTAMLVIGLALSFDIVLAATAGYGLASGAIASEQLYQVMLVNAPMAQAKGRIAESARKYRLPVDATITARRAGEALYAISAFGNPTRSFAGFRPPARRITGSWRWPGPMLPTFPRRANRSWPYNAFQAARAGLSDEQSADLARAAAHPAAAEFAVLARASREDFWAALLPRPLPPDFDPFTTPGPNMSGVKAAAYSEVAHAAQELSRGHADSAQWRLRGVIGAGTALLEGRTLLDALLGSVLIAIGRDALEALYDATGRSAEARDIRLEVLTASEQTRTTLPAPGRSLVETMRTLMRDTTALSAVRWDLALVGVAYEPCADLNELVFGADSAQRATYAAARPTMVRSSTDSLVFDLAEHTLDRPTRRTLEPASPAQYALRAAARLVDHLVGGHRFESCAALGAYVQTHR